MGAMRHMKEKKLLLTIALVFAAISVASSAQAQDAEPRNGCIRGELVSVATAADLALSGRVDRNGDGYICVLQLPPSSTTRRFPCPINSFDNHRRKGGPWETLSCEEVLAAWTVDAGTRWDFACDQPNAGAYPCGLGTLAE